MYRYFKYSKKTHRLIPSRYPPIALFDWAETAEELEQLALLEGLTNDRLQNEYGDIKLVAKEDWVGGNGSTPLMAAFTHPGQSRFSDGSFGVYYAGDSLTTAIAETKFHRELFLNASHEPPCRIQMREYTGFIKKELVHIDKDNYLSLLNPDITSYSESQKFGSQLKQQNEWGLCYPSVRKQNALCFAIFRPSALTIPIQGCHLDYIWDGESISEIKESKTIKEVSYQ